MIRPLALCACLIVLLGHQGCTSRPAEAPRTASWSLDDPPAHPLALAGYQAHFVLTWSGSRIGDATEALRRHGGGLRFTRNERISLTRGGALVHGETVVTIDTNLELRASRVAVWQLSGDSELRGLAQRDARGQWIVRYGDEPERSLPGEAVPAELVPLLLSARPQGPRAAGSGVRAVRAGGDHRFAGPVLLAGYGFATGTLAVTAPAPHRLIASLHTSHGVLRGHYQLTAGGTVARIVGEDGSGAVRVSAAALDEPFAPPEVVDTSSVPIDGDGLELGASAGWGAARGPSARPTTLVLGPVSRGLPPPLPGQHVERDADIWRIRLHAGDVDPPPAPPMTALAPDPVLARLASSIVAQALAGSPAAELTALTRATAELLGDDLGSPVTSSRAALALGRGDCTAHAALLAGLARARGITTKLVTGYRIDVAARRLVRHRWAIAAIDGAWIAVDPTFGEAPAAPRLLGLAVHDATAAEMALADELAFAGLGQARARALTR